MATLIAVHGTFAHLETGALRHADGQGAPMGPPELQWWQDTSTFTNQMRDLVEGEDGPLNVVPFVWSGDNSERHRRKASSDLLDVFEKLESQGEAYCAVGHSHGGSVISGALMLAASRDLDLPGLKRWITVGTPFVDLEKERFLFSRLPLLLKSVFVASLMLFFMFVVSTLTDIINGGWPFDTPQRAWRFGTSLVLTAMPFVIFQILARWHERRRLYFYRGRNIQRARDFFADRWLALTHEDDEVVSGLGALRNVNLKVFQRDFAVSSLTLGAVFLLPVAYVALVTSPRPMVSIAGFLKDNVYAVAELEKAEDSYIAQRRSVRSIRRQVQAEQQKMSDPSREIATQSDGRAAVRELRRKLKKEQEDLRSRHPDFQKKERALRFKRRFFQHDGRDCIDGKLCFEGRSIRLNSKLLFHLVTDEVARFVVDEGLRSRTITGILRYALPIVLVPLLFGALAMVLVLLAQFLARFISGNASRWLDRLTWSQVRRSVLGNDTEAEVALGAIRRPFWIAAPRPFLPSEVGDLVTSYSNDVTTESLAKFRNAISELAFAERGESDQPSALSYLTWKELVHASYFEVPEFRKLVAFAMAQEAGFQARDPLASDPFVQQLKVWLGKLAPTSNASDPTASPPS